MKKKSRADHRKHARRQSGADVTPQTNQIPSTTGCDQVVRVSEEPGEFVPYDENQLERARTQWQFGDWVSLAKLERTTLQHHPDRAKLALLAAAGHIQLGDTSVARQFTQLAQDWGCSKKLISQVLISGVHNTLGCAAAVFGQQPRALKHFESAIAIGTPGSDARLIVQARIREQLVKLGLPGGVAELQFTANYGTALAHLAVPRRLTFNGRATIGGAGEGTDIDYSLLTEHFLRDISLRLLSENESEQRASLVEISVYLQKIAKDPKPLETAITNLDAHGQTFHFMHVAGDYIPRKIADEKQFYESKFLDLLGVFHRPGGLIIDGGANIGNHTAYFAKVLDAVVIAIEPEPHNATCLAINMALNGISEHVHLFRQAIGSRSGSVTLQMNVEANFGSFSAKPDSNPNRELVSGAMPVEVPMTTLDALMLQFSARTSISILKLDVERMELDVLRGAEKLIQTSLPLIAVECFSLQDLACIESQLEPHGYFPVDSVNATPTFIFVSRNNSFHLTRLIDYLRISAVERATKKNGFSTTLR